MTDTATAKKPKPTPTPDPAPAAPVDPVDTLVELYGDAKAVDLMPLPHYQRPLPVVAASDINPDAPPHIAHPIHPPKVLDGYVEQRANMRREQVTVDAMYKDRTVFPPVPAVTP